MRAPALLVLALAGCATARPPTPAAAPPPPPPDTHLPPYVRNPVEPFSRTNVVVIAEREWRAFGSQVDDGPPRMAPPPALRPDQQPGLWQRVADYWWSSADFGSPEGAWGRGSEQDDGIGPAWSAAFVSYVMRTAGAGRGFVYSPLHADYINAAARGEGLLHAERPDAYAPQLGDLICLGRGAARGLRFEDLPSTRFFAHCDVVTAAGPGRLSVVGGNVSGSVTLKHVPTTVDGTLAEPGGRVIDPRWAWFVVLRVAYP